MPIQPTSFLAPRRLSIAAVAFGLLTAGVTVTRAELPPRTERHTLHSDETGKDYEIWVQVPGSYGETNHRRYPAIYLTDAQWDFALISQVVEKLVYDRSIPEVMLVGISYAGKDPDYAQLREQDLTPTQVTSINPRSGGAPQFLQFIESQLIPFIEKDFRAAPDARVLGGSSYGGLFSLFVLQAKPGLFGGHIANSPAATWDHGWLLRPERTFASIRRNDPIRVAVNHGGDEYSVFRDTVLELQRRLAAPGTPGLALLQWENPDMRHAANGITGWTRGLVWTLRDLRPTGPSPLQEYFETLESTAAVSHQD